MLEVVAQPVGHNALRTVAARARPLHEGRHHDVRIVVRGAAVIQLS